MSSLHWQDFWINDRLVGEVDIDAAYAGHLGVPVVLVTGDDKVCSEAVQLLGAIETAEVKQSVARHRALVLPPVRARELIRESACRAVQRADQISPLSFEVPVEIRLRYTSTHLAERRVSDGDRVERIDGRTVVFRGQDVMEALRRALA
jgi:D-amino peptidase